MRRKSVGNGVRGHHTTPGRGAHPGRALVACGLLGVRLLPRFVLYPSFCRKTFCYIIPRISRGPFIVFSSSFVFELFLPGLDPRLEDVFIRGSEGYFLQERRRPVHQRAEAAPSRDAACGWSPCSRRCQGTQR